MTHSRPGPTRVTSIGLERLKSLPQTRDVWQLAFTRMPKWTLDEHDQPIRPMLALCHSQTAEKLGNGDMCLPGEPLKPSALDAVASLAVAKGMGYRPARVQVRDAQTANLVREDLATCGIEVEIAEHLEALDAAIGEMAQHMRRKEDSERLFDPALDLDCLRQFADAAAELYRAAPWNLLTDEDLVCVESPRAPKGMGAFTVLGAGGVEFGLGFYASKTAFKEFAESDPHDVKMPAEGLWLMSYEEEYDWPMAEAEYWNHHELALAGEHAYPSLECELENGAPKFATRTHLEFAEAVMRALTASTEDEIDSGRWTKAVATSAGPVAVEFALPAILEAIASPRRKPKREPGELPDRRLIEDTMRDLQKQMAEQNFESLDEANAFLAKSVNKKPTRAAAVTPQEKAQELVSRALEEHGRVRIKLAREALRLWPDCAEAWVLRAENMRDPARRRELYQQGVEAAERALGPKPFKDDVGHFWSLIETRPYMRARYGLSEALWSLDQRDEAIAHWQDLLRLCPGDNMGVRRALVPRLLEQGRDTEAAQVLDEFSDDRMATLRYANALLEYRRSGEGAKAKAALDRALRANAHVPMYLTRRIAMDSELPESYTLGSQEEARLATIDLIAAWSDTPGALEWLSGALRPPKSERRALRKQGKGPGKGRR